MLQGIAEKYFKLKIFPFSVKIECLLCPLDVYYDKDMTDVSFKFLKGLIDNTDKYIKLCTEWGKSGGYLFKLNVDEHIVRLQVDVKLNKENSNHGNSY